MSVIFFNNTDVKQFNINLKNKQSGLIRFHIDLKECINVKYDISRDSPSYCINIKIEEYGLDMIYNYYSNTIADLKINTCSEKILKISNKKNKYFDFIIFFNEIVNIFGNLRGNKQKNYITVRTSLLDTCTYNEKLKKFITYIGCRKITFEVFDLHIMQIIIEIMNIIINSIVKTQKVDIENIFITC